LEEEEGSKSATVIRDIIQNIKNIARLPENPETGL